MYDVIADIFAELARGSLDGPQLEALLRKHSARAHETHNRFAKKQVIPAYLKLKAAGGAPFDELGVTDELEERFMALLKVKPRRTASGVATITVITKPWPCKGSCIFCPSDMRMPKSYLHDEPACQRAERSYFDPYIQVAARLEALVAMGHATDKIELIILGGTWSDYPPAYRFWYVASLFAALNNASDVRKHECNRRAQRYEEAGISNDPATLARRIASAQKAIDCHAATYNEEFARLYEAPASPWRAASEWQQAQLEDVTRAHAENEHASHRVVGLVVETRPDAIDAAALRELRTLGCTKVQMGIQSLDPHIRTLNGRAIAQDDIVRAFELCRLFGFKTHIHHMANLKGATVATDKHDFKQLVSDVRYLPDEVKLYPCALIGSAPLAQDFAAGTWVPYSEEELIELLTFDLRISPPYLRISRMIRDFSSSDIMAGNKKTNLRQMVEARIASEQVHPQEIRHREVGVSSVDVAQLILDDYTYATSVSTEHFLQWVTPEDAIAGFLRLSLPQAGAIARYARALPVCEDEAMIREVHIYGFAAPLQKEGASAQHHGLGRALIERACEIAREAGYRKLNVISAVGTRAYYRKLGFVNHDSTSLYQQRLL